VQILGTSYSTDCGSRGGGCGGGYAAPSPSLPVVGYQSSRPCGQTSPYSSCGSSPYSVPLPVHISTPYVPPLPHAVLPPLIQVPSLSPAPPAPPSSPPSPSFPLPLPGSIPAEPGRDSYDGRRVVCGYSVVVDRVQITE